MSCNHYVRIQNVFSWDTNMYKYLDVGVQNTSAPTSGFETKIPRYNYSCNFFIFRGLSFTYMFTGYVQSAHNQLCLCKKQNP